MVSFQDFCSGLYLLDFLEDFPVSTVFTQLTGETSGHRRTSFTEGMKTLDATIMTMYRCQLDRHGWWLGQKGGVSILSHPI